MFKSIIPEGLEEKLQHRTYLEEASMHLAPTIANMV